MRKKILSMSLVFCMLLAMLPVSAMADVSYKLWVGGTEVTSAKTSGTGWIYDPSTNTLTLDNATITSAYTGWGGDMFCIYSEAYTPLILNLIGENIITGVDSIQSTYGIYCRDELTIKGEGSLTVTPGKAYIKGGFGNNHSSGILTRGGLTTNDTTLDIRGEQYGLYEYGGGNITINGGNVTAYGGNAAIVGKLKTNGQKVSVNVGDEEPGTEWDGSINLISNYKYVEIELAPYFITNISMTNDASVQSNTDLTLSGSVYPDTATNQDITWSVENANGTGATINDGIFRATSPGTARVKASVENGLTADDAFTRIFDITVTAATVVNHTITATATTGGSISPSGSVLVNNGESQDFTITPNSNYSIGEVMVDGVSQGIISTYTFNSVTRDHTISATFNYNGDSSGSGSGDRTPRKNSSIIITRPTADQPDRPTQGEIKVLASVDSKGNVTVRITDKNVTDVIDKVLADAEKNGNEKNGITVVLRADTDSKTGSNVTVNLPKSVQEIIIAKKIVNIIVVLDKPNIKIDMDLETIKEINSQAKSDVNITATTTNSDNLTGDAKKSIGNRPVFDLKVNYGNNKQVKEFGEGSAWVTIPYTLGANEKAENIFAVYIDENGAVHWLTESGYDSVNKVLHFRTNHFSTYGVGYKEDAPVFTDIASHWAKEEIEFVVRRGLFGGTSDKTFSPDTAMTRGMFVTVLGRLANAQVDNYIESSFEDVKSDAYYIGYIEWANKNNIVNGTGNNNFAPDQAITREHMAVIMSNYVKTMDIKLKETHGENTFDDNAKINDYAKDAVRQMQIAGILSGKYENLFDPQGLATRAEVSAVLQRFVELINSEDTIND